MMFTPAKRPPADAELPKTVKLLRRLNAPPQRVFRAWSDRDELVRWLPTQIEGSLAVGTRSTLVWPDERIWWDVAQAESPRTFVLRRPWSADERLITQATIRIEPIGYGSRVDLEDGPFPIDQPGVIEIWAKAIEHRTAALA
jgi:uncharacterized protein YndB with AHSA1/START domain